MDSYRHRSRRNRLQQARAADVKRERTLNTEGTEDHRGRRVQEFQVLAGKKPYGFAMEAEDFHNIPTCGEAFLQGRCVLTLCVLPSRNRYCARFRRLRPSCACSSGCVVRCAMKSVRGRRVRPWWPESTKWA